MAFLAPASAKHATRCIRCCQLSAHVNVTYLRGRNEDSGKTPNGNSMQCHANLLTTQFSEKVSPLATNKPQKISYAYRQKFPNTRLCFTIR